ncbi:heparanase-like protein 1 [Olea europaea var. sylvestris]|uniref:heparanase-like protein 1 n=1 Tax=Olea europaea var. sylvestris TaxID=158386 RepID=UPI000C1D0734|nr:heparanase-like protein 1 [Olea europaea var. sylvestris]
MGFRISLFILLLVFSPSILAQNSDDARLVIHTNTTIAETDDNYVCATIDWWPHDKCNYNQCPWEFSSVINLDLSNPFLANAVQAFKNFRLRLGGSLQDQVLYEVGNLKSPCKQFEKDKSGLFGFSRGCLHMKRWDELNNFFKTTGWIHRSSSGNSHPFLGFMLLITSMGQYYEVLINLLIAFSLFQAGVTLLLINLSNQTTFNIDAKSASNVELQLKEKVDTRKKSFAHGLKRSFSWVGDKTSDKRLFREEYHLTPEAGNLQSRTMLLNGQALQLTERGDIPSLSPVLRDINSPITISPLSIKFIVFANFYTPGCK